MRKTAVIFLLAVLAPSLALAWLALRSIRDQRMAQERQQTILYQGITDAYAQEIQEYLTGLREEFNGHVRRFVEREGEPHGKGGSDFDAYLTGKWAAADTGFVVTASGRLLSPNPSSRPGAEAFCRANGSFLAGEDPALVYTFNWQDDLAANAAGPLDGQQAALNAPNAFNNVWKGQNTNDKNMEQLKEIRRNRKELPPKLVKPQYAREATRNTTNQQIYQQREQEMEQHAPRQQGASVQPNAPPDAQGGQFPQVDDTPRQSTPAAQTIDIDYRETRFGEIASQANEGAVARLLDDGLTLLFWRRPEEKSDLVFGARADIDKLKSRLEEIVREPSIFADEVCVALLDDKAQPVSASVRDFQADWRRPFVATEVGEMLPHWEVGLYLLNPGRIAAAANTVSLVVTILVVILLAAIVIGGYLIFADLWRQVDLARKKTDFVSNVSHELKTPLTSIRMFSEMLADGRVRDERKRENYLRIITAETHRLTRLINNVLDFSRGRKGKEQFRFAERELAGIVSESVETFRPHLEQTGFTLTADYEEDKSLPVRADADAIAQVLVNLLSNAEKYSVNGRREIDVVVAPSRRNPGSAEVRVLDRGPGVPNASARRIFEQFFRADDALSNGVQGSGLGLPLARQIARAHGGDVRFEPREGGGSCFVLDLPLAGGARLQPEEMKERVT